MKVKRSSEGMKGNGKLGYRAAIVKRGREGGVEVGGGSVRKYGKTTS